MKNYVKLVESPLPGEKNGKEIGTMFFIVVKGVKRIRQIMG